MVDMNITEKYEGKKWIPILSVNPQFPLTYSDLLVRSFFFQKPKATQGEAEQILSVHRNTISHSFNKCWVAPPVVMTKSGTPAYFPVLLPSGSLRMRDSVVYGLLFSLARHDYIPQTTKEFLCVKTGLGYRSVRASLDVLAERQLILFTQKKYLVIRLLPTIPDYFTDIETAPKEIAIPFNLENVIIGIDGANKGLIRTLTMILVEKGITQETLMKTYNNAQNIVNKQHWKNATTPTTDDYLRMLIALVKKIEHNGFTEETRQRQETNRMISKLALEKAAWEETKERLKATPAYQALTTDAERKFFINWEGRMPKDTLTYWEEINYFDKHGELMDGMELHSLRQRKRNKETAPETFEAVIAY